jgi:hypothetical protein
MRHLSRILFPLLLLLLSPSGRFLWGSSNGTARTTETGRGCRDERRIVVHYARQSDEHYMLTVQQSDS